MHLLIPFAAPLSEAGRQSLGSLELPRLRALLALLGPWAAEDEAEQRGDELSLSTPHERALARALGWQGGDGQLPWAARAAEADGLQTAGQAWGLLSPAHWRLGTEQLSLVDPEALALAADDSRGLFDTVAPLFRSEGFAMHWAAPLRWYAAHDSLAGLPCASLDRVIGRNVDLWLTPSPQAHQLRRLQSEVQMLLYTHEINTARTAQGLLTVNSFWLSGCGRPQRQTGVPPQVEPRLRAPALAEDWAGWVQAWLSLDEGPVAAMLATAQRGEPVRLTLCGERRALSFECAQHGLWQRLRSRSRSYLDRPSLAPLWERL